MNRFFIMLGLIIYKFIIRFYLIINLWNEPESLFLGNTLLGKKEKTYQIVNFLTGKTNNSMKDRDKTVKTKSSG